MSVIWYLIGKNFAGNSFPHMTKKSTLFIVFTNHNNTVMQYNKKQKYEAHKLLNNVSITSRQRHHDGSFSQFQSLFYETL